MNKQEAIEEIKKHSTQLYDDFAIIRDKAIQIVNQIDEPQKPKVPQFVADWYEENKCYFEWNLYNFCVDFHERKLQEDLREWFADNTNEPIETLVMMHKFGYEIEKEKLYTVELPNPNGGGHVVLCKTSDGIVSIAFAGMARWKGGKNFQLTESEIKQDFEWAWQFAEEVNNND